MAEIFGRDVSEALGKPEASRLPLRCYDDHGRLVPAGVLVLDGEIIIAPARDILASVSAADRTPKTIYWGRSKN